MNKKFAIILIIMIIAVAAVGFLLYGNITSAPSIIAPTPEQPAVTTNGPTTPPTQTGPVKSPEAVSTANSQPIIIQNFHFIPDSLTIKQGTKVAWINTDSVTHLIASDNNEFSSKTLGQGNTFAYTFNTIGTFKYHCGIHPSMLGSIIVTK